MSEASVRDTGGPGRANRADAKAYRDYGVLWKLQATGLLSVNLSIMPSPVFRIIAHVSGDTIDRYGHQSARDNFFFQIRYPRLPFSSGPYLDWPLDVDAPIHLLGEAAETIPNSSLGVARYFSSSSTARYLRRLRVSARRLRGAPGDYPAATLALKVCAAIDPELTREKAMDADLEDLFNEVATSKTFRVTKPLADGPRKKFAITSAPRVEAPARLFDDFEMSRQERVDTLKEAVPDALYISDEALRAIQDHISWGERTRENQFEQGGIIIGEQAEDRGKAVSVVTCAISALETQGSQTYVKFDHLTWKRMLDQFDQMVATGQLNRNQKIIGWYHTHPNMSVFMSGTDMGTQRSLFYNPWNYALVLNPQQQFCGCFKGKDADIAPLVMFERARAR